VRADSPDAGESGVAATFWPWHASCFGGGRNTGRTRQVPMSIRDTSAQDRPVTAATAAGQRSRKRRQTLVAFGIGAGVLLLAGWLVAGWASASRSFDADRVRIAEVTRGDLVRDITADGRLIAANSPTLYAIAGGTVTLHVVAGDRVKKGQAL